MGKIVAKAPTKVIVPVLALSDLGKPQRGLMTWEGSNIHRLLTSKHTDGSGKTYYCFSVSCNTSFWASILREIRF